MKNIFFTLCMALFCSGAVLAQSSAIKVNLLGVVLGSANLGYEFSISDKASVEVGASFRSIGVTIDATDADASAFGAYGMYRLYLGQAGPVRNFYLAPFASYSRGSAKVDESKGSIGAIAAGALLGNQFVFGSDGGLLIDISIGFNYLNFSTGGDISGVSGDGFLPTARLSVGYAF